MNKKIRVLVVDDSAVIRQMLHDLLSQQPDIEVVGLAHDPYDAREKIKQLTPDVLTLDVEMPKMDGLSFLEKIMTLRPMPVVMVSTLTGKGTHTAIAALQMGAVECIAKPQAHSNEELEAFACELSEKIRTAAIAQIRPYRRPDAVQKEMSGRALGSAAPKCIAIGASTGGVEALTEVLTRLPPAIPPIVITQHMPPMFTASFASRLSGICRITVKEATDRMPLMPGIACLAAGGTQMEIVNIAGQLFCKVTDGAPVNNHKPSVDVLFNSVAQHVGSQALGVILTGMGKDGANGLLKMREAGAHTIGQDEASCVVYGMPRAAFQLGAVAEVCALNSIADKIIGRCMV